MENVGVNKYQDCGALFFGTIACMACSGFSSSLNWDMRSELAMNVIVLFFEHMK